MELDQFLLKKFISVYQRFFRLQKKMEDSSRRVSLDEIKGTSSSLARRLPESRLKSPRRKKKEDG